MQQSLNQNLIDGILSKIKQIEQIRSSKFKFQSNKFEEMVQSIQAMMSDISIHLQFLNSENIFRDDFNEAIKTIDSGLDAFLSSLNSDLIKFKDLVYISQFPKDFEMFSVSLLIFSKIFNEIITNISSIEDKNDSKLINNYLRLGIESSLFSFSVFVRKIDKSPYYETKFFRLYTLYGNINSITDKVVAFQSFCGTGKSLVLPLIILSRILKDNNESPFLLMTEPSPKHIDPKIDFFRQKIGKYVTITSDPDELVQLYKEKNAQSVVFGLLTPHNLLPLMYQESSNNEFYQKTRIIIDEIHQRTFHLDVLITKIGLYYRSKNVFKLPLNCILMSATVSSNYIKTISPSMKITQLINQPLYPIIEKKSEKEQNLTKITENVILEMSNINKTASGYEEGHILCFLSGIFQCKNVKKSISSLFRYSEETENRRKVVILETSLKQNETKESYIKRLRNEFTLYEQLREGKGYKYEHLYFVPIVLSGLVEDVIFDLAQNSFPDDINKINKLICSTPMIESSFTIDKLSVVIDSLKFKEHYFDINSCLKAENETYISQQMMCQRKGRLGRTMKGCYIPICPPRIKIPEVQTPAVLITDLSTNFLLMKDIKIDYENMINYLPTKPDPYKLQFAFETLKSMGAIDKENSEITDFGHELLNYPFISIYYAASVIYCRDLFKDNEEDKNHANFIIAFIALLITLEFLLLKEEMSYKLTEFFDKNSDVVTMSNALFHILKSEITDNDILREFVESYGINYSQFLVFRNHLQSIVDLIYPGKTVVEVIKDSHDFVIEKGGFIHFVDLFIDGLKKFYPKWDQIHSLKFSHIIGIPPDNRPLIIYNGDSRLKLNNQFKFASVGLSKRPGWKGIKVPSELYIFNISPNFSTNRNRGHFIHRKLESDSGVVTSISLSSVALNPLFSPLLSAYFSNEGYHITNLSASFNSKWLYLSNTGEKAYLSFDVKDKKNKKEIVKGVNDCLKLMPFVAKSVLIYHHEPGIVVELMSNGINGYNTELSTDCRGDVLDYKTIQFCVNNIEKMMIPNSPIRICSLFVNKTCKFNEMDSNNLYFITDDSNISNKPILDVIKSQASKKEFLKNVLNKQKSFHSFNKDRKSFGLFQFPINFIHPALIYNADCLKKIEQWFDQCSYAKIRKVIGYQFLMKLNEIDQLNRHIQIEGDEIKKQIDLKFTAIPIPNEIYSKEHLEIDKHPAWNYDYRFRVIITTNEEAKNVSEFIKMKIEANHDEDKSLLQCDNAFACYYTCDDPENPNLTCFPITVYMADDSTVTRKCCRDCILLLLERAVETFVEDGVVNDTLIEGISIKPPSIPAIRFQRGESEFEKDPQVPIGQFIASLINEDDDKMKNLVSAYLYAIEECAIRVMSRDEYTYCPDHPHIIYKLSRNNRNNNFVCNVDGCKNQFCKKCFLWHLPNTKCHDGLDNLRGYKTCPHCFSSFMLEGGCPVYHCKVCHRFWCGKCNPRLHMSFKTYHQCELHLRDVHSRENDDDIEN